MGRGTVARHTAGIVQIQFETEIAAETARARDAVASGCTVATSAGDARGVRLAAPISRCMSCKRALCVLSSHVCAAARTNPFASFIAWFASKGAGRESRVQRSGRVSAAEPSERVGRS